MAIGAEAGGVDFDGRHGVSVGFAAFSLYGSALLGNNPRKDQNVHVRGAAAE
jgi:hypothetical protein